MIFLIQYDRKHGRLITPIERFKDSEREEARARRLSLEIEFTRSGKDHEVVLLEAESEQNLQKTHSRYVPDSEEHSRVLRDLEKAEEVWKALGNALGSGDVSSEEYHAAVAMLQDAKKRFQRLFRRTGTEPLR